MVRQQELPPPVRADSVAVPAVLGGMLAVGLFAVFAPAAASAGPWLVVGIPLAAVLAGCCASAVAIADPDPGDDYACARAELGVFPARMSGVTALVAQVAGAAAVAGTIGDHLAPGMPGVVTTTVLLLAALAVTAGVRVPAGTAWWWVAVLVVLFIVLVTCAFAIPPVTTPSADQAPGDFGGGVTGAAGVVFFAFAGVERLVRSGGGASRGVPLRVPLLLAVVAAAMLVLAVALLRQLGAARLALSPTPVLDLLGAADAAVLRSAVATGVGLALAPLLPWLLHRLRATARGMAADGELPSVLRTPRGAVGLDLSGALAAAVLAWWWEPAALLALAACCLLVHYAFTLVVARLIRDRDGGRRLSVPCLGMALAVVFAVSMPVPALFGTLGVSVAGPLIAGAATRRWR